MCCGLYIVTLLVNSVILEHKAFSHAEILFHLNRRNHDDGSKSLAFDLSSERKPDDGYIELLNDGSTVAGIIYIEKNGVCKIGGDGCNNNCSCSSFDGKLFTWTMPLILPNSKINFTIVMQFDGKKETSQIFYNGKEYGEMEKITSTLKVITTTKTAEYGEMEKKITSTLKVITTTKTAVEINDNTVEKSHEKGFKILLVVVISSVVVITLVLICFAWRCHASNKKRERKNLSAKNISGELSSVREVKRRMPERDNTGLPEQKPLLDKTIEIEEESVIESADSGIQEKDNLIGANGIPNTKSVIEINKVSENLGNNDSVINREEVSESKLPTSTTADIALGAQNQIHREGIPNPEYVINIDNTSESITNTESDVNIDDASEKREYLPMDATINKEDISNTESSVNIDEVSESITNTESDVNIDDASEKREYLPMDATINKEDISNTESSVNIDEVSEKCGIETDNCRMNKKDNTISANGISEYNKDETSSCVVSCSRCTLYQVVIQCLDCGEKLCSWCEQVHAKEVASKHHKTCDIGIIVNGIEALFTCSKHGPSVLDYYCEMHDKIVCRTCIEENHYNCQVETVFVVAEKYARDFHNDLNSFEDFLQKMIDAREIINRRLDEVIRGKGVSPKSDIIVPKDDQLLKRLDNIITIYAKQTKVLEFTMKHGRKEHTFIIRHKTMPEIQTIKVEVYKSIFGLRNHLEEYMS